MGEKNITEYWKTFFEEAKIPNSYVEMYVEKFVAQGMEEDVISNINDEELQRLGITLRGHVLKILNYIKSIKIEKEETFAMGGSPKEDVVSRAEFEDLRRTVDEFIIDHGLMMIGEAANVIMGAFGDRKSRTSKKSVLKKLSLNQKLSLPEVDNRTFTMDDYLIASQQTSPTQFEFDSFLDNAYELKNTYSHESATISVIDLKKTYSATVCSMKRSPMLEKKIREKRLKLMKKSGKNIPKFEEYERMQSYF